MLEDKKDVMMNNSSPLNEMNAIATPDEDKDDKEQQEQSITTSFYYDSDDDYDVDDKDTYSAKYLYAMCIELQYYNDNQRVNHMEQDYKDKGTENDEKILNYHHKLEQRLKRNILSKEQEGSREQNNQPKLKHANIDFNSNKLLVTKSKNINIINGNDSRNNNILPTTITQNNDRLSLLTKSINYTETDNDRVTKYEFINNKTIPTNSPSLINLKSSNKSPGNLNELEETSLECKEDDANEFFKETKDLDYNNLNDNTTIYYDESFYDSDYYVEGGALDKEYRKDSHLIKELLNSSSTTSSSASSDIPTSLLSSLKHSSLSSSSIKSTPISSSSSFSTIQPLIDHQTLSGNYDVPVAYLRWLCKRINITMNATSRPTFATPHATSHDEKKIFIEIQVTTKETGTQNRQDIWKNYLDFSVI